MGKILIGKHSAIVGFTLLVVLVISFITAITAAIYVYKLDALLFVICLITLIVWIGVVLFCYRNFDKLKTGFSNEKE